MAPSLEEPVVTVAPTTTKFTVPVLAEDLAGDNKFGYQPGRTPVTKHDNYAYEDFLPSFPDIHWSPLEYTPYQDKGLRGDSKFRNLLRDATAVFDLNPKIGTEIHGVDLSKLDDAQRDDLARLIAYRGVVFFRSQKNFDIESQRQLGQYWGKLHRVRYLTRACLYEYTY
jgi:sulfonate dioxygenase